MSRIGKKPIPIPKDVKVDVKEDAIVVKGPRGVLQRKIHPEISIQTEDDQLLVSASDSSKKGKSLRGLYRALIANMVTGVSQGFERALEIVGVGYRGEISGRKAIFHLGYSHPVQFELPEGIDAKIDRTRITLSGADKELLGKTAAKIRSFRKPEPYKGKGIKYAEETVRRKAGKTGTK
ncbi:MAG: 50S ribosomal protein L6 [Deltaproteobacteria bacterium]|mgnify:CR=1 FL=1|nr:50S ribosomal protein L6 [Deltaproteobacteria bacterium]MBW1920366.1 50S ribosomal protein L6 [Deltaproteobacteria bacterium]MBW1934911.1 50S ribosomal protein L6 [Deltaproteobacteria bacterium]MBW1978251.1 50S ribosomal protein L6 [Deltaproteobacteria bacterium]MBW2044513.1 50S ribosomal protein L6 [Deltaproteobacteria bacterium]